VRVVPRNGVSFEEAERQVRKMQESLELTLRYQSQTQTMVKDMAADMLETHALVQGKLAQLAAEGKDTARTELQDLAAALHEQMALVRDSGVLEPGCADAFASNLGGSSNTALSLPHNGLSSPLSFLCSANGDRQVDPENPENTV